MCIVGGIPTQTLQEFTEIDIIVIGGGDETIVELMSVLEEGSDIGSVKGIAYRRDRHIVETMRRLPINDANSKARTAGLFVAGNFMIGHLEETWETAMDTINLACKLKQEYASFAIAIPFPGIEIYQYCLDKGIDLPS